MRAAPPVTVQCTGGLAWRLMRAGLPALAVASLCAWALGHSGQSAAWALLAVPAVGLMAWPLARQAPVGLVWDGQRWTAGGVPGVLGVMIDVGAGLLLRLRPDEAGLRPQWVAVSARDAGPAMHALRAAAYAHPAVGVAVSGAGPDGVRLPR